MSRINDLIFRTRVVLEAIESDTGFSNLDPTSREILFCVGQASITGQKLNVTEITRNSRFGSPAKIFGRIANLIEQGWLVSEANPRDGRGRILKLGKPAVTAFNRMSANLGTFLKVS